MILPVSASTPRCNFRQDRRVRVPCFSTSHSPGPHSRRPVLSTSKCRGVDSRSWSQHLPCFGLPAQRRMIRQGEIETEQADDRPDQSFGLAQRQAEHGAQGQCRRDRQGGIVRLSTARGPWVSTPGRDCGIGKPYREAPALAQGGIILRSIRDLVPLLRNMMAAVGIHLEGHGAIRKTGTLPLRRPRLRSQIGPICDAVDGPPDGIAMCQG